MGKNSFYLGEVGNASKMNLVLQVFVKWGNTVTFFACKMNLILQVFKALLQANTVKWGNTVTFFASKMNLVLQVFKALLQAYNVKWDNTVTFFASKMNLVLQVFKALLRPIPSNGVIPSPFSPAKLTSSYRYSRLC
jgi:hypothetical protein